MDDVQNVGIVLADDEAASLVVITVEFVSVAFCCSCVASNRKIESSSVAEFESADCGGGNLTRLAFCCCSLSDDLLRCMRREMIFFIKRKSRIAFHCTQLTWQRGFFVS